MRRQSLRESLDGGGDGGSVMTNRSPGRAQFSLHHPSPVTRDSSSHSVHPTPHQAAVGGSSASSSPSRKFPRAVGTRSTNYHQQHESSTNGCIARRPRVVKQIARLPSRNLVLLLPLVLCLLFQMVASKPQVLLEPERITFKSRICQPVPATELKKRLGAAFDDERMAADMATASRWGGGGIQGSAPQAQWADGYQGDSPAKFLDGSGSTVVEAEQYLSSGDVVLREKEMMHLNRGYYEDRGEVDIDFDVDARSSWESDSRDRGSRRQGRNPSGRRKHWHQSRRTSEVEGRTGDQDVFPGFGSKERETPRQGNYSRFDSFKYMRRKRRRRSLKAASNSRSPEERTKGSARLTDPVANRKSKSNRRNSSAKGRQAGKKMTHTYYPLRLLLTGRFRNGKKLRKQLKKEFRQQNRKLNKPPPWQCKYAGKLVYMKENVFPRYVRDGVCTTDKCFYRLYRCEPVQYTIKLLQRDENHCVPVPRVGNGTVYEESWNIVKHRVTVACSCASALTSGKTKGRRKN